MNYVLSLMKEIIGPSLTGRANAGSGYSTVRGHPHSNRHLRSCIRNGI